MGETSSRFGVGEARTEQMAARGGGAPQRTLQEALEERRREFWNANPMGDPYEDRASRLFWVGRPLRVTDKLREARETRKMMGEDPDTMEDYTLRGYKLSDFGTRPELESWAYDHIPAKEYEEAKANIMAYGQTAVLRVRDTGGS